MSELHGECIVFVTQLILNVLHIFCIIQAGLRVCGSSFPHHQCSLLFFLLPWNKPNYIIQSSMSLLILLFSPLYLFPGRFLYYPDLGWKFLFNFSHACSALLLGKYSVNDSSMIWKKTFSSYAKIRLFCTLSLIWLSILSYLIFYTVWILHPTLKKFSTVEEKTVLLKHKKI